MKIKTGIKLKEGVNLKKEVKQAPRKQYKRGFSRLA